MDILLLPFILLMALIMGVFGVITHNQAPEPWQQQDMMKQASESCNHQLKSFKIDENHKAVFECK